MNKVGKYIIISLLLLLGLGCVGILYLFFIPNSTLFNITYINLNDRIKSLSYNVSASSINQIKINSRSYDLNIVPVENSEISLEMYTNSFGFVFVENSNFKIVSALENGILTFDIDEPHGFATTNNSYINLSIPKDHPISLDLTNKNSSISISSKSLILNNLSYSTNAGEFNFFEGKINGNLNLKIDKGSFNISKNVETNSNNIQLGLTKGKFNAADSSFGNITVTENQRGVISVLECVNFYHNSEHAISAGGQINIGTLSQTTLRSSDTKVSIKNVTYANIDLTGAGDVFIDKVMGYSPISTTSGNIIINNSHAEISAHTTSGNITIKNAMKTVSIRTISGTANVSFSEDAEKHTSTNRSRVLHANIHNGTLNASGVEHIGHADQNNSENIIGITITGNGSVNLTMNDVSGSNSIYGNDGNVNIVINDTSDYILNTSTSTGNVRVNLKQISESGGYRTKTATTTNVNCNSSSNNLNVSTNAGNLTILDSLMYQYGF